MRAYVVYDDEGVYSVQSSRQRAVLECYNILEKTTPDMTLSWEIDEKHRGKLNAVGSDVYVCFEMFFVNEGVLSEDSTS